MKKMVISFGVLTLILFNLLPLLAQVKISPGDIGNKAANLVFLQEHIGLIQPDLQAQGYSLVVPDFIAISTDKAQRFLTAQHISLERRWRSVEKHELDESFDENNSQTCKKHCGGKEADIEKCKQLCEVGGKFEKISTAVKMAHKTRKRTSPSSFAKVKKSSTELGSEVQDFLKKARENEWRLMVRSSGKEDSEEFSNAGGNESIANVSPEYAQVKVAVNAVIASYVAPKSMSQRCEAGDDLFCKPYTPVLLQRMIGEELNGADDSDQVPVGCVIYTQEPFGNTPGVTLIQSSFGHNEGVVNSSVATDSFYVDKYGTIHAVVKKKTQRIIPTFDGLKYRLAFTANPSSLQTVPTLMDADIRILKKVADAIQSWYGKPMDIELIFERHTKTVYLVQARPLQLVQKMHPEYTKATEGVEHVGCITVSPDDGSVRHITRVEQILIAPTLNDALNLFNTPSTQTKNIKIVAVQSDAEATSHAAAIFRGAGKPIVMVQNIEKIQEWLNKESPSIYIDVQREIIINNKDIEIVSGWFTHPISINLSVGINDLGDLSLPVTPLEYYSGAANQELVEMLKADDFTKATKALASLSFRVMEAVNGYEQAQKSGDGTVSIARDTFIKFGQLKNDFINAAAIFYKYGLSLGSRDITRMYYVKAIEALLFQPNVPQVVNAFSRTNLDARYLSYATFINMHTDGLTSSLVSDLSLLEIAREGSKSCFTKKLEDNWVTFVSAVAHMSTEEKANFELVLKTVSSLGALPMWINISFNRKWSASSESVSETLKTLVQEYSDGEAFLQKLNTINSNLDAISIAEWEKPEKFDSLLADFDKNVLQFFLSNELLDILAEEKNVTLKKVVAIPMMSKFIDTFDDKFIKTFKGSTLYKGKESQHVANFRRVVTTYFSILDRWAPLIRGFETGHAEGYTIRPIPEYINSLGLALKENMSNNEQEFLPSEDFFVASQTFPNYSKNTKFKLLAKRLEDFFTLTHQNINFIINQLMKEVELGSIERPDLFIAVEKEVLKIEPSFRSNKISLIGVKISDSLLNFTYNLPLKVHGETFDILYDKNTDVVYVTVTIVTDDSRAKNLEKEFAITFLSRAAHIELKSAPRILTNEISYTLKITTETPIRNLYTLLMFINSMTYSQFTEDQFKVISPDMKGWIDDFVKNQPQEAKLLLFREIASKSLNLNVIHYILIKALIEQSQFVPGKESVSIKNVLSAKLPEAERAKKAFNELIKDINNLQKK